MNDLKLPQGLNNSPLPVPLADRHMNMCSHYINSVRTRQLRDWGITTCLLG